MSKLFDYALSQVPDEVKRFVDNSLDIANQIHAILERQGKTQRDLANALGKKESEVSKWLTGTHNFTVKSLSKIEAILNDKILTTPLQSQQDFLKMQEHAVQLLQASSSSYSAFVKHGLDKDHYKRLFNEIRASKKLDEKKQRPIKATGKLEEEIKITALVAGESPYAMAA